MDGKDHFDADDVHDDPLPGAAFSLEVDGGSVAGDEVYVLPAQALGEGV